MPDLFLELRDETGSAEVTPAPLAEDDVVELLRDAEFTASRLVPWGSNYTFAVALEAPDSRSHLAIYKPQAGEAPLYDFPDGSLYRREHAAYLFSKWAGWDLVPPTVVRDGPHGIGSVQLYVQPASDGGDHHDFWSSRDPAIERMVLFDHIVNNADRKISHCLRDESGKVWGIDHGLTFNREPKLRTVLWQFVGEPISPPLMRELRELHERREELRETLAGDINSGEIEALLRRITRVADHGCYPALSPRRNVPYGWW